jgi:two-component sensor histidine kinase
MAFRFSLKDVSIKRKLIFIVMASSSIVAILACSLFIIYDRHSFKAQTVNDLEVLADVIGINCTAAISFDDRNDAQETLRALNAEHQILTARVYSSDGLPFADYIREGEKVLPPDSVLKPGHRFADNMLELSRIFLGSEVLGGIYLKSDLGQLQARVRNYIGIVSAAIFICLLFAFMITLRLQKIVSGPIGHLAEVAKSVSKSNDYSIRASKHGNDELGLLVLIFNDMLSRIQISNRELLVAHDMLEERVKERTRELENEIRERKTAEGKIKESLREKEILLKEIHHRVKNNLQIITSLLSLQSKNITDSKALGMFKDSQARVKSMALIHEKLYRSDDLARVDFGEYIQNLTSYLSRSFAIEGGKIRLKLDITDILFGVDCAVPCGLIINELVSNCFKHAFPNGGHGWINISLRQKHDDNLILTVADDGIGFPMGLDYRQTDSLGLQLINTLSEQLGGTLAMRSEQGTEFVITFPLPKSCKDGVNECLAQKS